MKIKKKLWGGRFGGGGGGVGSGWVGVSGWMRNVNEELIPTAYVKLITFILLSFIQKVDQTAVKHQFL